jgi:hypothetical protein
VKLPLWAKWIWWLILVGIITFVLWKRLDLTAAGRSTPFDSVAFVVWVALLLAPIFSEVKIWGVELKQEIKDVKKDLSEQIHAVKAEVRNSIYLHTVISPSVPGPPPDDQVPLIRKEVERALPTKTAESVPTNEAAAELNVPANVEYLFSVRYNVEGEVRRITQALLDDRTRTQIRRQVQIVTESGLITRDIERAILDVYRICSPALHGDSVSDEQIGLVQEFAPRLLATLRQIPELRPD